MAGILAATKRGHEVSHQPEGNSDLMSGRDDRRKPQPWQASENGHISREIQKLNHTGHKAESSPDGLCQFHFIF